MLLLLLHLPISLILCLLLLLLRLEDLTPLVLGFVELLHGDNDVGGERLAHSVDEVLHLPSCVHLIIYIEVEIRTLEELLLLSCEPLLEVRHKTGVFRL